MGSLIVLLKFWKPKDNFTLADEQACAKPARHSARQVFKAWLPYLLLVVLVFLWGLDVVKEPLNRVTMKFQWLGLHNAAYTVNWMTTAGTACAFATLLSGLFLRVTRRQAGKVLTISMRQLAVPVLTIAVVLSFASLMNYSGATGTLGLVFASTGRAFPFFGTLLGWLGVFLVGSDTSSNALFGNLQVETARRLGYDPVLMAAANSSGGVMGKMISLSSIAVAVAATGLRTSDESKLFRFALKHSVILATAIGLIVALYAWLC